MPRHFRGERYADIAGLALLLAGAAVYLLAERGLRALTIRATGAERGTLDAMTEFDRLWMLSRSGLALAGAGVGVLVITALIAYRLRRRLRTAS